MQFENSFDVRAPVEEVWHALMDIERVAPCMPGAQVLERKGEDAYGVGIRVKLGPMTMQYRGEVEIVERDAERRRAVMSARARETRGQGIADANVEMTLSENGEVTHGVIRAEVQLSGRAAAMGQGVIADVSAKLVETFAGNLAGMLAGEQAQDGAGEQPHGEAGEQPHGEAGEQPHGEAGEHPPGGEAAPGAAPAAASEPAATAATTAERDAGPNKGLAGQAAAAQASPADSTLPVGSILASVAVGRLQNPRTLLASFIAVALTFLGIGLLLGRLFGGRS
jgi:uncharacterized protein